MYDEHCMHDAWPGGTRWAGPDLGYHTDEILRTELGYKPEQIEQLRKGGVI